MIEILTPILLICVYILMAILGFAVGYKKGFIDGVLFSIRQRIKKSDSN